MPAIPANPGRQGAGAMPRAMWLRKHAEYQRVYKEGKRQSLPLMTYFFARRAPAGEIPASAMEKRPGVQSGPRVGLTTGRVLGNAVVRNRIKRRMRAAVRLHQAELRADVDVILHPRRTVMDVEYSRIERDVLRAFRSVQAAMRPDSGIPSTM
ncbi:MAG: ribonuclease P protein component [Acidobacteriaceae bacterium]